MSSIRAHTLLPLLEHTPCFLCWSTRADWRLMAHSSRLRTALALPNPTVPRCLPSLRAAMRKCLGSSSLKRGLPAGTHSDRLPAWLLTEAVGADAVGADAVGVGAEWEPWERMRARAPAPAYTHSLVRCPPMAQQAGCRLWISNNRGSSERWPQQPQQQPWPSKCLGCKPALRQEYVHHSSL